MDRQAKNEMPLIYRYPQIYQNGGIKISKSCIFHIIKIYLCDHQSEGSLPGKSCLLQSCRDWICLLRIDSNNQHRSLPSQQWRPLLSSIYHRHSLYTGSPISGSKNEINFISNSKNGTMFNLKVFNPDCGSVLGFYLQTTYQRVSGHQKFTYPARKLTYPNWNSILLLI